MTTSNAGSVPRSRATAAGFFRRAHREGAGQAVLATLGPARAPGHAPGPARAVLILSALALIGGTTLAQDAGPATRTDTRPLAGEKSPYLRQHVDNPVAWHPWGEEAFAKAVRENKPIFLSIGYASCHWCHVMEHESFENAEVARILNGFFVPIKVDREERPDVDRAYMQAAMTMTGRGGWPLSMFLTPERKPFFAGTYFPIEDRPNETGFLTVIASIRDAWAARRPALLASADRLDWAIRMAQLSAAELERRADALEARAAEEAATRPDRGPVASEIEYIRKLLARKQVPVPANPLERACEQLLAVEDRTHGGFGDAPKFPSPVDALALLRHFARTRAAAPIEAVRRQYDAMADGGIHDHLAGGFHRYATDRRWEVPHFEKMLYDQALIARVYLELWQATGNPSYEHTCRKTLDFCLARMRSPEGAFIAAHDASVGGLEGATYLWTRDEIEQAIPAGDARALFERWSGFDQSKPGEKRTIARRAKAGDAAAGSDRSGLQRAFDFTMACELLLEARDRRPQPAAVGHVLTAWNAWMVSTLARAGLVLNEPRYRDAAVATMAFLDAKLRRPDGLYARRFFEGETRFPGELSDQAAVLEAKLDLHEATLDPSWLDAAVALAPRIAKRLQRPDGTFDDSVEPDLIFRTRELSDGSTPSGNSQMNVALARLARITGRAEDLKVARDAIAAALPESAVNAADHAYGAIAWDLAFQPAARVVFHGPRPIVLMLRAPLLLAYRPHVVMTVPPLTERGPADPRAYAVVWIDQVPSEPVRDSAALLTSIERLTARPESR